MSPSSDGADLTAAGRWQHVQEVLAEAIDCPASRRAALLDARCSGDPALRQDVESLLAAHDGEGAVDRLGAALEPLSERLHNPDATKMAPRIGHYVVQDEIGTGGMGVVYRACDTRLGRQVALKFLPPHSSADPAVKARFVEEARAAAALDHPGVCTIHEIGETADGELYIVMPLYGGETLQSRLERGRLTFAEALPIALQVAHGLEHAHEAGIVHRDVKPSNIVLLPNRVAKILDFGIAQMRAQPAADPQAHALVGTVFYMSPEQARAGAVDRRSDIWSLGVVIHEMLAGTRPFDGADQPAVLRAILQDEPFLAATSYPDVPAGIDRVLRRALAKAPEQRYTSMSALAADLLALTGAPREADGGGFGAPLDDVTRMPPAERRRAAVLVTAVSDYPSLVDRLTPLDADRLVAPLRDLAVGIARKYGGLVNQASGDEIVSLFGVPVAHDDDDLRAVRAALELHAAVTGRTGGDGRVPLAVQSGLHVGPVVARRLQEGSRRYEIVGAPAALAARLAALAGPGEIWVSPETQRLVAPYMETAPCPPVVLESRVAPVTPFQVIGESGVATRLEASSRTGLTPYVGRDAELSALEAHARRAADGGGGVVGVVGEAGAGKSRLLYELRKRLENRPGVTVLSARCRAYGDGAPYGVFVQILRAALDLDLPPPAADRVVARLHAIDAALDRYLPLLLQLLSVDSPVHPLPRHLNGEPLQQALLDALAAAVGALVRRRPLLVLIEDWQWADSGSRAAMRRVAELTDTHALLLILTSREDFSVRHDWAGPASTVRLARLDPGASSAIARAALNAKRVPETLARQLHERAGGNPFFLEQMCAALLERRAVTVHDGEARIEGGTEAAALPDTVQGVVRARLDNLDADALELVRVASVMGREFDHALLAEVVPAHVDLGLAIVSLQDAGLIEQASVSPTIRYRFAHVLTQEVCYDSLVGHQRKQLHGVIGRALAATHAHRSDDGAAVLAHHFGQAEDWSAAIYFGRRAAQRALALSQFEDALGTLDQVAAWLERLPGGGESADMADVLLQQERVCETLGLRARQQQIIDTLIGRLAWAGRSPRLAEAYLRQGDLSTLLKRFEAADRALGTAIRIGREHNDAMLVRSGLRSLGLLRWHEGRHAEALDITRQALALDRECGDEPAVAVDLTNLGNILKAMGDYVGARVQLEAALAMPALRNDPKKLVYTQHILANVYRAVGDVDRALDCLVQSDEIARVYLQPIQRSFHLTSIAHIQLQQGHVEAAIATYQSAVDLSRRARHADGLVQSLRMLGNALLGVARYEEALPHLREAAGLFAQLEDHGAEAEMRAGIARILERTSPAQAADAWAAVLAVHRARGDAASELEAREGLARALRLRGGDAAIPAFEAALALAMAIGARAREAAIRNVLGILEWQRHRYAEARHHYEAALVLVRTDGTEAEQAVVLNSLGVVLTKLGLPDEARTVLEESVALSRQHGQARLQAHGLTALGLLSLETSDLRCAVDCFTESRALRQAMGDRTGEGWMDLRLAEARTKSGDAMAALNLVRAAETAAGETGDRALSAACAAALGEMGLPRSGR